MTLRSLARSPGSSWPLLKHSDDNKLAHSLCQIPCSHCVLLFYYWFIIVQGVRLIHGKEDTKLFSIVKTAIGYALCVSVLMFLHCVFLILTDNSHNLMMQCLINTLTSEKKRPQFQNILIPRPISLWIWMIFHLHSSVINIRRRPWKRLYIPSESVLVLFTFLTMLEIKRKAANAQQRGFLQWSSCRF